MADGTAGDLLTLIGEGRLAANLLAGAVALALYAGNASAQATLPQPPAAPRFEIQRFIVEGNTLLSQGEVDGILTPFSGKNRDFADIQRALEALQEAYRRRGYNAVRVSIPEQDIRAGQVRLHVLEARIRRVRVQDNRFFGEKNVRAGLPSVKEGTTPDTRAIRQDAQLVNENPAKQVSVALQATDDPGQVDATVRVTDEKVSRISAYADNTGTPSTGRIRTGLGYQNANLFNGDDVLNVQAIGSPGHASDVKIFGTSYRVPIYSWGGVIDALAGYSSVNSGTVQDVFSVSGKGSVFGLRYTQLLARLESYEHRIAFGLDHRAYKNNVTSADTSGSLVPDITVRPATLIYSGRASKAGQDLSFNLSYSRNIPGGSKGGDEDFENQRPGANPRYGIYREGAAFSRALPADFILRAAANAQQTHDLLIPSEQFGMGGADSVRGYYERETANDVGRRFSLEAYGPDFGPRFGNNWRARALVFVDTARGRDNAPERGPENKLGSFGFGVRANQGKAFAFRFDAARVTEDAGTRRKGDTRVHFAVAYSY